jgi:hypothetical protein
MTYPRSDIRWIVNSLANPGYLSAGRSGEYHWANLASVAFRCVTKMIETDVVGLKNVFNRTRTVIPIAGRQDLRALAQRRSALSPTPIALLAG